MNEQLREYLRENETVCWESRPKPFAALDGKYKMKFLSKFLITLLISGGIGAGHLASGTDVKVGVLVLLAGLVIVVALMPVMERMRLMKGRYWITDQRIIMLDSNKLFHSMEIDDIDAFKVMADEKADSCLVLGSSVFQDTEKNMRWRAGNPKMPEGAGSSKNHALGMILYNAENVEEAVALLKKQGRVKAA